MALKEKASKAKEWLSTILLMPVAFLFMLWLLIITPFDYFKYKRTQYYKDTKEKYSWFCAMSSYIELYELIKKEKLPIDYFRCHKADITGYGYFIYNGILILKDYEPFYDAEKGMWTVEIEDEYVDIEADVQSVIEECNGFLKGDICKKAVVLIDKDVFDEHPNAEYANFEFVPICDGDVFSALKKLVEFKQDASLG